MVLDTSNQLLFQFFFGFNSDSRIRIYKITHAVENKNPVVALALLIVTWHTVFNLE